MCFVTILCVFIQVFLGTSHVLSQKSFRWKYRWKSTNPNLIFRQIWRISVCGYYRKSMYIFQTFYVFKLYWHFEALLCVCTHLAAENSVSVALYFLFMDDACLVYLLLIEETSPIHENTGPMANFLRPHLLMQLILEVMISKCSFTGGNSYLYCSNMKISK